MSWPAPVTFENRHEPNPTSVLWFGSQLEFPKVLLLDVVRRQRILATAVDKSYNNWVGMVKELYKEGTPLTVVRRKYKFWLYSADEVGKAFSKTLFYFDRRTIKVGPDTLQPLIKIFFEKHRPFVLNESMSRNFIKRRWDKRTGAIVSQ